LGEWELRSSAEEFGDRYGFEHRRTIERRRWRRTAEWGRRGYRIGRVPVQLAARAHLTAAARFATAAHGCRGLLSDPARPDTHGPLEWCIDQRYLAIRPAACGGTRHRPDAWHAGSQS